MASIKLALHPQPNKNNKQAIVLAVIHQRKQLYITLPVEPVLKTDIIKYENNTIQIKNKAKYTNIAWTNKFILNEKEKAEDSLLSLYETNKIDSMSIKQLTDYIRNSKKSTKTNISEFLFQIYEARIKLNKVSIAYTYKGTSVTMKSFDKDLCFENLDYNICKKIELFLIKKKLSNNSIISFFCYLKAAYKLFLLENPKAIDNRPFNYIHIKREKVQKRALSLENINKIKNYIPKNKRQEFTRDIFLFSYYNQGITIGEIIRLKKTNIVENRLHYTRRKTGDFFNIKLSEESLRIINKHSIESNLFLFPFLKNQNISFLKMEKKTYSLKASFNYHLNLIGKELNLPIKLTSYVARHSFATIAKNKNTPIHVISQMLGHEDTKITQVYLSELDTDEMDKYLEQIEL